MTDFGYRLGADRRTVLAGAAATAALLASRTTWAAAAATGDMTQVKNAIATNHAAAVKRLQDWIGFPSIAAEKRNSQEGAEYMKKLVLDAGFQHAEVAPTSGSPACSPPWTTARPRRSASTSCST